MLPIRLWRRKVNKQGGAKRISLPAEWSEAAGVVAGDEVDVVDVGILALLPQAELKDEEVDEMVDCLKRAIKIAYRNRKVEK